MSQVDVEPGMNPAAMTLDPLFTATRLSCHLARQLSHCPPAHTSLEENLLSS